jgi:hypothetical protein
LVNKKIARQQKIKKTMESRRSALTTVESAKINISVARKKNAN